MFIVLIEAGSRYRRRGFIYKSCCDDIKLKSKQNLKISKAPWEQKIKENLEILNKEHCPSKDMLYAKIFTDFEQDSNITPVKKQTGYSAQLLTP